MRPGTIVYFRCNDWGQDDWKPEPEEARRFLYEYIEGVQHLDTLFDRSPVLKTARAIDVWVWHNDLCIRYAISFQSWKFWVTTTKEWLSENFPELLPYASEKPDEDVSYLKYEERNIGLLWWELNYELESEEDKDRLVRL